MDWITEIQLLRITRIARKGSNFWPNQQEWYYFWWLQIHRICRAGGVCDDYTHPVWGSAQILMPFSGGVPPQCPHY